MLEYGALFNSSFAEQLRDSWNSMVGFLGNLPFYWYIVIIIVLILLARLAIRS